MMEHKHLKILIAALLAGGLVYFGMQYYQPNNIDDNVKIQDTTTANQSDKIKQMQDRLQKIKEKMKSLPEDKQEKLKQIKDRIKAKIEKMQANQSDGAAV